MSKEKLFTKEEVATVTKIGFFLLGMIASSLILLVSYLFSSHIGSEYSGPFAFVVGTALGFFVIPILMDPWMKKKRDSLSDKFYIVRASSRGEGLMEAVKLIEKYEKETAINEMQKRIAELGGVLINQSGLDDSEE